MAHDAVSTAMRMFLLVQLLDRRIARSSSELLKKLQDAGYKADLRTVQRDLVKLSEQLPIYSDGAKPAGWRWMENAPGLSLPVMDPRMALALLILEQQAATLLPPVVGAALQPKWDEARTTLQHEQRGKSLRDWTARVRVISRAMPLIPPTIDPHVRNTVFDALLHRTCFRARYRRAYQDDIKEYDVHPVAVVVREGVIYLVALIGDYEDPRQLALHRMISATPIDRTARELLNFDLDAYISEGNFAFSNGKKVRLVADFNEAAGFHLTESKISADQTIKRIDDGKNPPYYRLTATVNDSMQLKWWLQSFGDDLHDFKLKIT